MATAVTLTHTTPGDLVNVKGVVLEGVVIEARKRSVKTNKFWGADGESRMDGGTGGRDITVPVLIYDDSAMTPLFPTARKLADYLDYTLNGDCVGRNGKLKIVTLSNHSEFVDCDFEGAELMPGEDVKQDIGGTLGGGYFAICLLRFRQLSNGAPEPPPTP